MPNRLKVLIIISVVMFFYYAFRNIKRNKVSIQDILIWFIISIGMILAIVFIDPLASIADIFGVKSVPHLLFFVVIFFLLVITFNITKVLSAQQKKIVRLTQELAILKNEMEMKKK